MGCPSFFAFFAFAVKKLVFIEASIDLYALAPGAIAAIFNMRRCVKAPVFHTDNKANGGSH
jgi:hypothetical protein